MRSPFHIVDITRPVVGITITLEKFNYLKTIFESVKLHIRVGNHHVVIPKRPRAVNITGDQTRIHPVDVCYIECC